MPYGYLSAAHAEVDFCHIPIITFPSSTKFVYDRLMEPACDDELLHTYPTSVRLVGVKIRNRGEVKKLDAVSAPLRNGDPVLLEVDGEVTYGIVYTEPYTTPFLPPMRAMKSILRKPDAEETALIGRLEQLSQEAASYCRTKAAELNISLKLVEVYGAMHRRQLTFVYTAEDRIDFRELVRDLARRFGGRIEMRQVGVREEARRLGGIDTCGLVLVLCQFSDRYEADLGQAGEKAQPDDRRPSLAGGVWKAQVLFDV